MLLTLILFLRRIASWRMYPNACWYAALWFIVYTSDAEFFIRLINGREYAVVVLHERTSVRYVFCNIRVK